MGKRKIEHKFQEVFWNYMDCCGWEYAKLATRLHVDVSTISAWITGRNPFPLNSQNKICHELGIQGAQVEEFKSLYKRYWEWKQEEKRKNDNVAQELKVIDSEREQEQSLKTILFDEDESTIYVPWSLPDRIPYFKFRSEVNTNSEVQQLQKLLATDSVVTLYGPGGVGKTALAIEIAWSVLSEEIVRDIYPDCIL